MATAIAEEMDMLGLEEATGDERTPEERPANAHMKQAKSHNQFIVPRAQVNLGSPSVGLA